jgi:hypothetical protein
MFPELNRLTPNTKVVASISPIFFDLETLIDTVVENGKPLFILDQISDARNFVQSSELKLSKWYC